ncbi:hypothetical protein R3P38DRAFT_3366365 [Favolaschia claudopus]|uniref:Uncharacterized protein n=1 Tax=Favolaschia claudopus TaxID=2862362 RepID=A0AAW0AE62_9AGAR
MVLASIEDDPDVNNEFLAFVHNFSGPKDWFKHKRQKAGLSLNSSPPKTIGEGKFKIGVVRAIHAYLYWRDVSIQSTVVFRPSVHWVSPVTYNVHWISCSEHSKLPDMRKEPWEIWVNQPGKLGQIGSSEKALVPELFPATLVNTWSEYYSTVRQSSGYYSWAFALNDFGL